MVFLLELRTIVIISHFNPGDSHPLKRIYSIMNMTGATNKYSENRNGWHVDSLVTLFEAYVGRLVLKNEGVLT